jgi:hypothetical protein
MQRNDDLALFSVMDTSQVADSFTHVPLDATVTARLLSLRCQEAQDQASPNQDYATLTCRQDRSSLCFCVCDGVSSSYKGDYAAHYLATHLVTWLQDLPDLRRQPQRPPRLLPSLQAYLNQLATSAQSELTTLALPENVPHLVREVLEELRLAYGSETVFFCGRLDYDLAVNVAQPVEYVGKKKVPTLGQALFFWMGNVTARLCTTADQCIVLGDDSDQHGRWSTVRGCRGALRAWSRPLKALQRLTIYTDGLDTLGPQLSTLDDTAWQEQTHSLLASPANDDMTVLELRWQYPASLAQESPA